MQIPPDYQVHFSPNFAFLGAMVKISSVKYWYGHAIVFLGHFKCVYIFFPHFQNLTPHLGHGIKGLGKVVHRQYGQLRKLSDILELGIGLPFGRPLWD